MKKLICFLQKKYVAGSLFALILIGFTVYVALDTFVIPRAYLVLEPMSHVHASGDEDPNGATGTDTEAADTAGNIVDIGGQTEITAGIASILDLSDVQANASDGEAQNAEGQDAADLTQISGQEAGTEPETEDQAPAAKPEQQETTPEETAPTEPVAEEPAIEGPVFPEGTFTEEVVSNDTQYTDSNISIHMSQYYEYDTVIYVADVYVRDVTYLQTALAKNTYGRNIVQTTSKMASDHNAIFAVNGDYYGAQEKGYVLRNGVVLRTSSANASKQDLAIMSDGNFKIFKEGESDPDTLLTEGALQILSFGPGLVKDGVISVGVDEEVPTALSSNPRTAIGEISPCHYVFVVGDGRTEESAGLSLYELAEFMTGLGVDQAYNLDGGGSSTMYFNGKIVNKPTSGGYVFEERVLSDIVYIGY